MPLLSGSGSGSWKRPPFWSVALASRISNVSPSWRLIVEWPSRFTNIRLPWSLTRLTCFELETPIMFNLYSAVDGFPGSPVENDARTGILGAGLVASLAQAARLAAANTRTPKERDVGWCIVSLQ